MSRDSFLMDARLAEYYAQHGYREPALLAELREETARHPMAKMQIAPEQGQLLQLLLQMMGARRVIEVGVFTGYSSLAMAQVLPDDGHLLACDVSDEWTQIARRYWQRAGVAERIRLVLAPAAETLAAEVAAGVEAYDFAFIDADKAGYLDYYEACLQLLRPGGLIAVDNVLWSGAVADPADQDGSTRALKAFNARVADDARVQHCLVPIGDGLTLCRKR